MRHPGEAGMWSMACRTPAVAVGPSSPSPRALAGAEGSVTARGAALLTTTAAGPSALHAALAAARVAWTPSLYDDLVTYCIVCMLICQRRLHSSRRFFCGATERSCQVS
jgi:hypothetical protein